MFVVTTLKHTAIYRWSVLIGVARILDLLYGLALTDTFSRILAFN